eukprot:764783-Hanusia_phi.AAC.9
MDINDYDMHSEFFCLDWYEGVQLETKDFPITNTSAFCFKDDFNEYIHSSLDFQSFPLEAMEQTGDTNVAEALFFEASNDTLSLECECQTILQGPIMRLENESDGIPSSPKVQPTAQLDNSTLAESEYAQKAGIVHNQQIKESEEKLLVASAHFDRPRIDQTFTFSEV